jgi:hypothetical protein
MGIGRTFQEALQKACQSLEIKRNGLGADGKEMTNYDELIYNLKQPELEPFVLHQRCHAHRYTYQHYPESDEDRPLVPGAD